jgi:hypothetical protein
MTPGCQPAAGRLRPHEATVPTCSAPPGGLAVAAHGDECGWEAAGRSSTSSRDHPVPPPPHEPELVRESAQTRDRPEEVAMTQRTGVPRRVRFFSPILKFVLVAGVPIGPNRLVTIRGRKSGLPRTTPLAIIEVGGRRWVWAPWGEVPMGAQSARRRLRDYRDAWPDGRSNRDRAGPHTARWLLSRHPRSARARHTAGGLVHSHRRWCRSRRSGRSGRGSTCLRTPLTWMTTAAGSRDGHRDRLQPAERRQAG